MTDEVRTAHSLSGNDIGRTVTFSMPHSPGRVISGRLAGIVASSVAVGLRIGPADVAFDEFVVLADQYVGVSDNDAG